jgi:hypothetical protein
MKETTKYKIEFLKFNSIAGSLCEAIWLIGAEIKLEEQSWDGINYNISNSGGCFGTFSFINDKEMIGVSFDKNSKRNPFDTENNSHYDYRQFFKEVPENIVKYAERETLQYMLQDLNGKEYSIITSLAWSENKIIMTNEPWDSALENGLFILEKQLLPVQESMQSWKEYYGLNDMDMKWVLKIVEAGLNDSIEFSKLEKEFFKFINTKKPTQNGSELFQKHFKSMDKVLHSK